MQAVSLDALITETRAAVRPLGHRPSTVLQYEYAWRHFLAYATARGATVFSPTVAAEYLQDLRHQYEAGGCKAWRFKLARKAVSLLAQQADNGEVRWTHLPPWDQAALPPHHTAVLTPYTEYLMAAGYERGTRNVYRLVAQQLLQYLDQARGPVLAEATWEDVSRFIPAVGTLYQPTSMRTVLSAGTYSVDPVFEREI